MRNTVKYAIQRTPHPNRMMSELEAFSCIQFKGERGIPQIDSTPTEGKKHISCEIVFIGETRMERNSFMRLANFLRYNSPSKRQIRRMVGRPKSLSAKDATKPVAAVEPLSFPKKEGAPFAVLVSVSHRSCCRLRVQQWGKTFPYTLVPCLCSQSCVEYRNNGSRRLTIIRRIEGSIDVVVDSSTDA